MKKLFFYFMMFYTSFVYAESACKSYDEFAFDIVINNHTSEICSLLSYTLNNGLLTKEKIPPMVILANEKSRPLHLNLPSYPFERISAANIELSYQCGPDKFVTIESQKSIAILDRLLANVVITITGSPFAVSNMDAKYSYTRGSCEKNQSSTLEWTFY